jgi:hypothetical protein
MFILLIDVDDDTRSVVFNDLSLHDMLDPHSNVSPPLGFESKKQLKSKTHIH